MKDEYLWNKKGSDTAVEELELTLGSLRLKATEAPRIAVEPYEQPRRWNALRLAFSGAAFALASVIALSLFVISPDAFYKSGELSVSLEDGPAKISPVAIPDAPLISEPGPSESQIAASRPPKARAIKAPVALANEEPSVPSGDQFASLTNEEREAYDQLILALSVTSSSLRLVQEKANGDLFARPGSAEEEIQSRSN